MSKVNDKNANPKIIDIMSMPEASFLERESSFLKHMRII